MKTKMTYIAPETEMIDLKLEQGILAESYHLGGGDSYGDSDTNDNGGY